MLTVLVRGTISSEIRSGFCLRIPWTTALTIPNTRMPSFMLFIHRSGQGKSGNANSNSTRTFTIDLPRRHLRFLARLIIPYKNAFPITGNASDTVVMEGWCNKGNDNIFGQAQQITGWLYWTTRINRFPTRDTWQIAHRVFERSRSVLCKNRAEDNVPDCDR